MDSKDDVKMSNDKNHKNPNKDVDCSLTQQFDLDVNLLHLGIHHWGYFPLGIYSIALFLVFMCPAQYMTGKMVERKEWTSEQTQQ